MRSFRFLLPALALLAGCFSERYESGQKGELDFKLSNGFWIDQFPPDVPLALGSECQLVARGDSDARPLRAAPRDQAVLTVRSDTGAPSRKEDGTTWTWAVRGVAAGTTVVDIYDGATVVDSVEVAVRPAASLDWRIYDPEREGRREEDTLRLSPGESLEIDILTFDEEGDRLAGVRGCSFTLENTSLKQDPDPSTPNACIVEALNLGIRGPLKVTAVAYGSTDLVITSQDGKARRVIRVRVG